MSELAVFIRKERATEIMRKMSAYRWKDAQWAYVMDHIVHGELCGYVISYSTYTGGRMRVTETDLDAIEALGHTQH